MSVSPLLAPPPVPSKYDIIPIHASDISNFLRCRRYWDWSSPTRNNLTHKVELYGVDPNLWFGTGIHYALENYYSPILQRDPVESFQFWFQLQWFGGIVAEPMMQLSRDPNPVKLADNEYAGDDWEDYDGPLWKVRGLNDLLPDPMEDEWLAFRELGVGMMNFYKGYAEKNDDFEVVAAESMFSVPLGFESIDIREESPNYGKSLEVHLRGKRDAILYYPERKDPRTQFGIHDYKTAGKIDDDYFLKLENDPQCTTYIVASVAEAHMHDLPWKTINEVLYTALRKVHPTPPTITSRGFPSINRNDESCTPDMFKQACDDLGLIDWFHGDEKAQLYYEWMIEEGDKRYVQRDYADRNPHQIKVATEELQMQAREMLDPNLNVYKRPTGMFTCTRCQFRAPCLAKDDGSDWKGMLANNYEDNKGR